MNNNKESSSKGIIGGDDGPTAVYVTQRVNLCHRQWQRVLDACKRQAVPKEFNFSGEEIKNYIMETYSGNDIRLLSRILAVVDAYDAMTQDRPYRKAMTNEDAIIEIMKDAGTQFDPKIAEMFAQTVGARASGE